MSKAPSLSGPDWPSAVVMIGIFNLLRIGRDYIRYSDRPLSIISHGPAYMVIIVINVAATVFFILGASLVLFKKGSGLLSIAAVSGICSAVVSFIYGSVVLLNPATKLAMLQHLLHGDSSAQNVQTTDHIASAMLVGDFVALAIGSAVQLVLCVMIYRKATDRSAEVRDPAPTLSPW